MGQAKRAGQPPQIGLPHVRQAPGRRSPPISGARQDQAAAGNARQDQAAAGNARQHQAVPGNARQHQAARRAAADRELLDEMAAAGFAGPVHEMFTSSLAAYGLAVMLAWIGSGEITARCQAAGRPLPGDAAPETLSADDRLEVAAETVARALRYFFIRVVRAGQWDHRRGTSLRTFFVGACVLQFPPVYGAWTGKRRWAGIRDGQNPGAEADRPGRPVRRGGWPDRALVPGHRRRHSRTLARRRGGRHGRHGATAPAEHRGRGGARHHRPDACCVTGTRSWHRKSRRWSRRREVPPGRIRETRRQPRHCEVPPGRIRETRRQPRHRDPRRVAAGGRCQAGSRSATGERPARLARIGR